MTILETIISRKNVELNNIKPKFYLVKGFLSTLLFNHFLVLISAIGFLLILFVDNPNLETEKSKLILSVIIIIEEIIAILFSFDFGNSIRFVNKWFGIQDYMDLKKEIKKLDKELQTIKNAKKLEKQYNITEDIKLSDDRQGLIDLYASQMEQESITTHMTIVLTEAIRKLRETSIEREIIEDWVVRLEKQWSNIK